MEITEVRVFPVNEERLKAYVTITLDACFVVRDLKVINGNTGLFVAMPAKRRKDGTFKDAGKIGLWTKADSVIHFDDLAVEDLGNTRSPTSPGKIVAQKLEMAITERSSSPAWCRRPPTCYVGLRDYCPGGE